MHASCPDRRRLLRRFGLSSGGALHAGLLARPRTMPGGRCTVFTQTRVNACHSPLGPTAKTSSTINPNPAVPLPSPRPAASPQDRQLKTTNCTPVSYALPQVRSMQPRQMASDKNGLEKRCSRATCCCTTPATAACTSEGWLFLLSLHSRIAFFPFPML